MGKRRKGKPGGLDSRESRDQSRSRYLDLDGGVETKSRFLDRRDKLFETVEIFSIVETYFLAVSRQIETPRLTKRLTIYYF
jgi:hypothetical protein